MYLFKKILLDLDVFRVGDEFHSINLRLKFLLILLTLTFRMSEELIIEILIYCL